MSDSSMQPPVMNSCPICDSSGDVALLLEKSGFALHRCGSCDHIFVDPQPSDQELARIYSFDAGYQNRPMVRYDEADAFPRKFRRSLDQIHRHVPSGSLLDVGCSAGQLLFMARARGYTVQGVELNRDTAEIARANGIPVFVGDLESAGFAAASFDVIHLGDVVEHVRNPVALLDRVRHLLKPRGVALIVTPNHDAFFPRATYVLHQVLGVPWSHPTPPFHLHQFSVTSLTALLDRCGFGTIEKEFAPCSLRYELRSTGVFKPLREALGHRRPVQVGVRSALCAGVTLAYGAVWAMDRAAIAKRRDFEMRVLASPAH